MDMSTMTMVGSAVAILLLAAVVAVFLMGSVRWVARRDDAARRTEGGQDTGRGAHEDVGDLTG